MELDIDFCDLEIDIKAWVEWEYDPDYSPNEGGTKWLRQLLADSIERQKNSLDKP